MMEASTPVTITVLGAAGAIGRRHVEHVLQNPSTAVHSIVDPSDAGRELAHQLQVPAFGTVEELTSTFGREAKPVGAIIATPSHQHVHQALQLLEHGVHVLVEKPVCTTVASGQELLHAAGQPGAGTVLAGYHRRFNPYVARLKAILDSGELGRVLAVQGTWAVRKPAAYFEGDGRAANWHTQAGMGGTLLTNVSHEIDLLRYLLGDVRRVFLELGPNTRGHDVDETGAATLRFASGAVATLVFTDAALSPFSFEAATGENPTVVPFAGANVYRLLGTRGSVELPTLHRYHHGGPGDGDWTHRLSADAASSPSERPQDFLYSHSNAPFTRRLEHWLQVMRGHAVPLCTAHDGVMATAVVEALRESARTGLPVDLAAEAHTS